MTNPEQAINDLRFIIADTIYNLEVWNSLYEVLEILGLPRPDNTESFGKEKYLHFITSLASAQEIISAARKS